MLITFSSLGPIRTSYSSFVFTQKHTGSKRGWVLLSSATNALTEKMKVF